jgi:hypothetical protein
MTFSLKHLFQSAKSDGVDPTLVQPSNWNAEHTIVMDSGKILGRVTTGSGAVEELAAVPPALGGAPNNRYTNFGSITNSGYGSTSTTAVMVGNGTVWKLTPASTGKVRVRLIGVGVATGSGGQVGVNYGTGTPPSQGAAVTGTAGNTFIPSFGTVLSGIPFTVEFEATGLTLGTVYWFDVVINAITSGQANGFFSSIIIEEF